MYNKQDKTSILNMFNSISKDYDQMNKIMSLGLHNLVKWLSIKNIKAKDPKMIADLCTGTGDIAILLAKKYPHAEITAIDNSKNMLNIAKEKVQKHKNIILVQADATNLYFDNETFDVCTISFGLRNLPDIDFTLLEIKRVLKPGGTLSILDLGRVSPIFTPIYDFYFFNVIPFLGKIFHKDEMPYKYLVKSIKTYPVPDEMIEKLKNLGFKNCKNINYMFGAIAQQIVSK